MRCEATTAKGTPCRANAKAGEKLCSAHLGTAHRPSLLSAEITDRIVRMVRAGSYKEVAARAAGIGTSTLYSWQERGEADRVEGRQTEHAAFVEALTRAEAEAEVHAIAAVRKVMETDWRAAMDYLARRYPERWAKREKLEHTGAQGGAIRLQSELSDPRVREALFDAARAIDASRSER